eukprot:15343244-Ditylum_brightwellii.AAC.1
MPFREERSGKLDAELLKKLDMSAKQMKDHDALFFYQLLFPICDTSKSNVNDDPQKNFYTDVAHFTNQYALNKGLFSGYDHSCDIVKMKELVIEMAFFSPMLQGEGS